MERRDFLRQAAITAAVASAPRIGAASPAPSARPIARRPLGKTGEPLCIIGFGGIVVMNEDPGAAANIVSEAVDRGINYFDIAPSYGNAQERPGPSAQALPRQVLPRLQNRRPHDGRFSRPVGRLSAPA
jgi:hypothetical protein